MNKEHHQSSINYTYIRTKSNIDKTNIYFTLKNNNEFDYEIVKNVFI